MVKTLGRITEGTAPSNTLHCITGPLREEVFQSWQTDGGVSRPSKAASKAYDRQRWGQHGFLFWDKPRVWCQQVEDAQQWAPRGIGSKCSEWLITLNSISYSKCKVQKTKMPPTPYFNVFESVFMSLSPWPQRSGTWSCYPGEEESTMLTCDCGRLPVGMGTCLNFCLFLGEKAGMHRSCHSLFCIK